MSEMICVLTNKQTNLSQFNKAGLLIFVSIFGTTALFKQINKIKS